MSLEIIYQPLSALIPYARNARTHDDAQVAQIAASIKEFGFCNPILVAPDGSIVAGHGRALAAHKLGLEMVPTIKLGHLTDSQRRAYVLADNRLAENASWDLSMLALEIEDLASIELDLSLLGFHDAELEKFLNGTPELQATPGDPATGATELSEGAFQDFEHRCPKCGFEFDAK